MHVKSLRASHFRRFTDLTISGLPATARLVVLAGPNGTGKSSVFDAFRTWQFFTGGVSGSGDTSYFWKHGEPEPGWPGAAVLDFHEPIPATAEGRKKIFYIRSAYRNDPDFTATELRRAGPLLDRPRIGRLIDNDATVQENYRRLIAQTVDGVYGGSHDADTVKNFRDGFIGPVRESMQRVFPDLLLEGPGDPLGTGSFFFEKGSSKGFHYKNLSGGEKAAFDLLLDLIVQAVVFDDSIYCIDEPETHLNTRLQATLLGELFALVRPACQLWIATHSIGMLRKARDLREAHPDEVVFLDFEGRDFDQAVNLQPIAVDREFWGRTLGVALDDLAKLIAPKRIVLCEGRPVTATHSPKAEFDAKCYRTIFAKEFADTDFLSVGNSADVLSDRLEIGKAIQTVVSGTTILRVIDRDDRSPTEIADAGTAGVRVLGRRHLEAYLLDDEILTAFCVTRGKPERVSDVLKLKQTALANSIARKNPPDDLKSAAGDIYVGIKTLLGATGIGNTSDAFLRDSLAPLVIPGSSTYNDLKHDIFDL